jgi:DNA-binding MarR family transcriptional regulator
MKRAPSARKISTDVSLSPPLWRGFLAWSESVVALVARDLSSATGLSRPDYEVLVRLYEAPSHMLTQPDLRESLGWSPSRLSHQLDRMQERDLLASAETGTGRLRDVRLTERGAREIADAVQLHDAAVRTHFLAAGAGGRSRPRAVLIAAQACGAA